LISVFQIYGKVAVVSSIIIGGKMSFNILDRPRDNLPDRSSLVNIWHVVERMNYKGATDAHIGHQ
jgi:hypothetical protein